MTYKESVLAAIQSVRDNYPEDIFPETSATLDSKGAKMARLTCDNILQEIEKIPAPPSFTATQITIAVKAKIREIFGDLQRPWLSGNDEEYVCGYTLLAILASALDGLKKEIKAVSGTFTERSERA